MNRLWKTGLLLLLATVCTTVGLTWFGSTQSANAANPTTMSFQGKVVNADGTNVTDGTYSFLFKLYTVGSGGSAVWTETQSSVQVTAGVFQVNLGSVCLFFVSNACNNNLPIDFNANPALYLGITFNSDPAGEMTPRVQLQSVPFAFNSDRVGGLTVSQLVQLSPGSQQSGFIDLSGNGTFGGTINLSATSGSTVGVINQNAARIVHTFGTNNFFAGANAGNFTTSGTGANTGIGVNALQGNSTGAANVAVGANALIANNTGGSNVGVGTNSLVANAGGAGNSSFGTNNLYGNVSGNFNTALGYQAGYTSVSANANTIGSFNSFLGYNAGPGVISAFGGTGLQNATAVGANAIVNQNDSLVLGCINTFNGCTATTKVGIGTATPSANLNVVGNTSLEGSLTGTSTAAGSNAALLQGAASATVPTLVLKAGATPGAAADLLQFQSSSAVLGGVQNDGVLNLTGSAGTVQYQNAITALGDKIGLYSSTVFGRYGLGIQANTLVAHIGLTSSAFAVRVDPASGQASSGTNLFSVSGLGNVIAVGTITGTTLNGTTGLNTGASAGTQRIDNSGNHVNAGNYTGSGAVTIQPGTATALTITGHAASTFSTDSGALTIQSASGTVGLGTSTGLSANGALAVSAGGTAQILQLNGSTSGKVQIGNISSGDIEIAGQGTGNILFGGGSGGSGCTITNSSGNFVCDGTITGTTLNGTTGINTGASAGTQRIDSSGNLVNIGNLTAAANLTITNTGSGNDITVTSLDQLTLGTGTNGLLITSTGATVANITDGTNSLAKVIDANVSGVNYGVLQLGAKASTGNEAAQCAAAGDVGKIYVNSTDKAVFACTAANAWEQLDNARANQISNAGSYTVTTTNAIVGGTDTLTITPTTANSDVHAVYDADITFTSTGLGNNPGTVTLRLYRGTTCAAGTLLQTSVYTQPTSGTTVAAVVSVVDTAPTVGVSNTYIVCAQRSGGAGTITDTMANRTLVLRELDITGADYAEVYYSSGSAIEPGTVVTSDSSINAGVKSSTGRYQKGLIGVVSTRPGHVLSDGSDGGVAVIVGLAGRVPVKASSENGPIKGGDLLTSSSTPGVAMKATKAGAIIGTALTDYSGPGTGEVMLFVSTGQTAGSLPLTFDNSPQGSTQLLADLMNDRAKLAEPVDLSSMFTDRLAAGLEIITPRLISDEIQTNNIVIGENGLTFKNGKGEVVASIDSDGTFHGNEAVNINNLTDALSIDNAEAGVAEQATVQTNDEVGADSGPDNRVLTGESLQLIDASGTQVVMIDPAGDAKFNGNLNIANAVLSGGLQIGGDVNVGGLSTFQKLATFLGKTIFRQDVEFDGHITVASDTAGYAGLRIGESSVHVSFTTPYASPPVVSANVLNGQYKLLSINNITAKGFDLSLAEPADSDITIGWTALAVNNPRTVVNLLQ